MTSAEANRGGGGGDGGEESSSASVDVPVSGRVPSGSGGDLDDITGRWGTFERCLNEVGGEIGALNVGEWSGIANEAFEQHRAAARRRMLAASDTIGTVRATLQRWRRDFVSVREQQIEVELALQSAQPGSQAELVLLERQAALLAHLDTAAADTAVQLRKATAQAPRTSLFSERTPPGRPDLTLGPPYATRHDISHHTRTLSSRPSGYHGEQWASNPAVSGGDARISSDTLGGVVNDHGDFSAVSSVLSSSGAVDGSASALAPVTGTPVTHDDAAAGAARRRWWVSVEPPTGGGIHDTLSRIAARELGDPNRWPEIYALNHGRPQDRYGSLQDPNLIHPGWVLEIQGPDHQPDQPVPGPDQPIPGPDQPIPMPDRPDTSGDPGRTPVTAPAAPGTSTTLAPPTHNPVVHNPPAPPVRYQPGHSIISTSGLVIGTAVAATIVGGVVVLGKATGRARSARGGDSGARNRGGEGVELVASPSIGRLADALERQLPPTSACHHPGSPAATTADTHSSHVGPTHRTDVPGGHTPHNDRRNARHDSDTTVSGIEAVPPGAPYGGFAATGPEPSAGGLCRALGIRALPGHSHQPRQDNNPDSDPNGGEYTVEVDLAAVTGLGLHGPGTHDALRATLVELLTPRTEEHPLPAAHVLIPAHDAHTLLGIHPQTHLGPDGAGEFTNDHDEPVRLPTGLRVVADLPAALDELEVEITRRLRTRLDPAQPEAAHEPLVLIAGLDTDIETHGDQRLQSVLDHGAPLGIAAVLAGSWVAGTTCHLDDTATITHASGPAALALRGTTLFSMPTQHTLDALDIFAQLEDPQPTQDTTDDLPGPHTDNIAGQDDPTATEQPNSNDTRDGNEGVDHDDHDDQDHELIARQPASNSPPSTTSPGQRLDSAVPTDNLSDEPDHETNDQISDRAAGQQRQHPNPDPHHHTTQRAENTPSADTHAGTEKTELCSLDIEGMNTDTDTTPLPTGRATPHTDTTHPTADRTQAVSSPPKVGPPPEALIAVYAFGGLRVHARTAHGDPLRDITSKLSPTQRKLLACLAASTRPVLAETLIDTCWPSPPADNALSKLHTAIYRLRAVLRQEIGDAKPALLVHVSDRYEFDRAYCWIDHHAFFDKLREARTASSPTTQAEALREVLALHTGALLDGDDGIDWLDQPRTHAHRETITAATTLADHLTTNAPEQATHYLATALAIDPHNEPTARQLIRLQLSLGHTIAAERTYNALTENLNDLGAQPHPATTQLIQQTPINKPEQRRKN